MYVCNINSRKKQSCILKEGGKGHLGVFEGSEAREKCYNYFISRRKNMSNKGIRMLKERERKGERNRIGKDGNSSQKTSIPHSESSVIVSETCGWM